MTPTDLVQFHSETEGAWWWEHIDMQVLALTRVRGEWVANLCVCGTSYFCGRIMTNGQGHFYIDLEDTCRSIEEATTVYMQAVAQIAREG